MRKRKLRLRRRAKVAAFVLSTALVFGVTTAQLDDPNRVYAPTLLISETTQLPSDIEVGTPVQNFEVFEKAKFEQKEAARLAAETEQKRIQELSSRGGQTQFRLSESERRVVECMVQGEAGGESYKGKMLVAQCIMNGCIESNMQPSQVRKQYQYSGWKTNVSEETKQAVRAVFDNGEKVVNEPILWFYAPKYCKGKFHETQTHVITEGSHKFFMRNPK